MKLFDHEFNYRETSSTETGSHESTENYKIIDYSFDKYIIKLKLTENNTFIDVLEIAINKDFLTQKQKMLVTESIETKDDYPE